MNTSLANIFTLPIFDTYLLYSPLNHIAAMTNKAAVESFYKEREIKNSNDHQISSLLNSSDLEIPKAPTDTIRPDFLGILPTRSCNFDCLYCGFNIPCNNREVMDLGLAVSAVDWMAEYSAKNGKDTLDVHFFGGEPFIAPDVVDTVIHRSRLQAEKYGLRPVFETATNGYFSEERCKFIGDYFDTVVLSFDGKEDIQNKYRPLKSGQGSYDTISKNALILSKARSELCIRMCATEETVEQLIETSIWFCKTFEPSILNFETLKPTAATDAIGLHPPDPWKFGINCVRAMKKIRQYGVKPIYSAASVETLRHSFCPVGQDSIIVSPDGRLSNCYLPEQEWQKHNMDMNIGRLTLKEGVVIDQKALNRVRNYTRSKPRCNCCVARYHCAGGCHVTHSYPGSGKGYNAFCIQTRIITICNLLTHLGYEDHIELLLDNRDALEKLVLQRSDLLEDWRKTDE